MARHHTRSDTNGQRTLIQHGCIRVAIADRSQRVARVKGLGQSLFVAQTSNQLIEHGHHSTPLFR
ncbi:Uncharacterised protein [Klebsiella pneumoniae]|nr:Uncharacterised protein [Klebsiella pneumoniae]